MLPVSPLTRILLFVVLALGLTLAACAPAVESPASTVSVPEEAPAATETSAQAPAPTGAPQAELSGKLILYSGRSEPLIQPVIDAFKALHPNVEILLKSGSSSQMANALLEEKANPQADLFITTEIFTIQTLAKEGILQAYRPAAADLLPPEALGDGDLWVGLTRRARVIMYNTDLVSPEEAPQSIFELSDPKWKGQIAAAGSTNGSMQAQIAVLETAIGAEATETWLNGLLANEVTFFGGHTDVRKAVGAGEFKIGLVNHYYYYLQATEGSPVGIVFPDQGEGQIGLITNLTNAGIINGAQNPAAAQAFIDFLLSAEGQKLFAELNYEYPILPGVALHPDVQPLDAYRMAEVNLRDATLNLDAVFALIEKVGLP
ncbi:MAG: ABC transporter substrate-binding protein [Chloroflexi bacterium HGW-Chloroflexi-6]|nr:MAG: ABC transporter substrate-binding protein [Chloroflexi bacterium HGW-Chloroflexi-6]